MASTLTQGDIMRELEGYSPTDFKQKLEHEVSSMIMSPSAQSQDPIMKDLMRIRGGSLPTTAAEKNDESDDYTMQELSLRLRELLELILDPVLPDDSRLHYEKSVKHLIANEPVPKKGHKSYPNDYVSRVLLDNYALFLKISTSYFNLSFSSLITRYLVSIIYSLECWEIYHLLYSIPNLEYILSLLDFDVKYTSFGYVVKPPANFLNFNLRQGLQYPFPFPFYNFSYHSVDPKAGEKKMKHIAITPYIDLRLDKSVPKVKAAKAAAKVPKPVEMSYASDSDQSSADSEDFRRWKIVYLFVEMTPERIKHDFDLCFVTPAQRAYEEEDYDSDRASLIEEKEQEGVDASTPGLRMVSSVFQKAFSKAHDTGLVKHTFLHQCKLMDPTSHKTCLKVFYGKNELHRHQEFVHATKKRLYRCAYCLKNDNDDSNKCYPRYDSLARHIRRKHGIVGRENKSAVMLARKVAETEEIFGDQYENAPESVPEGPEGRATLASNTGISKSLERMFSEGSISGAGGSPANLSVDPASSSPYKRTVSFSGESLKKRPKNHPSVASEPDLQSDLQSDIPSDVQSGIQSNIEPNVQPNVQSNFQSDLPYNEFRTHEDIPKEIPAQPWQNESVNMFEYQSSNTREPRERQERDIKSTVPAPNAAESATQYPQYHPYNAYQSNYGQPMFSAPEGGIMYGHPMAMGPQYSYMGAMYAPPYASAPVSTGTRNEYVQQGGERRPSQTPSGNQAARAQTQNVLQAPGHAQPQRDQNPH